MHTHIFFAAAGDVVAEQWLNRIIHDYCPEVLFDDNYLKYHVDVDGNAEAKEFSSSKRVRLAIPKEAEAGQHAVLLKFYVRHRGKADIVEYSTENKTDMNTDDIAPHGVIIRKFYDNVSLVSVVRISD